MPNLVIQRHGSPKFGDFWTLPFLNGSMADHTKYTPLLCVLPCQI